MIVAASLTGIAIAYAAALGLLLDSVRGFYPNRDLAAGFPESTTCWLRRLFFRTCHREFGFHVHSELFTYFEPGYSSAGVVAFIEETWFYSAARHMSFLEFGFP